MPKEAGGGKEKIGVSDIDGVLAMSGEPVIREVNRQWGLDLQVSEINKWTWVSERVAEITGSWEEGMKAEELWFDPEVLARAKPVEGAVRAMEELREMGWTIWAATSRRPNAGRITAEWIRNFFPMIKGVYMLEEGNNRFISTVEVKLAAVGMLGAGLYVDDDPKAIRYVMSGCQPLIAALITRGWNREEPGFEQYRVSGWDEVVAKVRADKP